MGVVGLERRSKSARALSTAHWKRVRLSVLQRDGWICYYCGADLRETQATVDHIVPRKHDNVENVFNTDKLTPGTVRGLSSGYDTKPSWYELMKKMNGSNTPLSKLFGIEW